MHRVALLAINYDPQRVPSSSFHPFGSLSSKDLMILPSVVAASSFLPWSLQSASNNAQFLIA